MWAAKILKGVPYISGTCDGIIDSSVIEPEIVFVQYGSKARVSTRFIGVGNPERLRVIGIVEKRVTTL